MRAHPPRPGRRDEHSADRLPPHPERPAAGAPLTRDDLLALHQLLASDSWFDQLIAAGANP